MPRLSPEQKAARRAGIGSSDVAELLGISPYEGASPVRLFAEKAGILPDDDEEEETTEQRVGHALEGALVALYESESGFRVETIGPTVETVRHPSMPWAMANLDARIVGKRAALEVKVVGVGMMGDWDLDTDDGIPAYVRTQCAWQMFVADLDEVHVVALVGGTGFRVYYVPRDRELEAILVREATAFRELVEARKPPPLDASSATRAYLNEKYPPPPEDVEVEAPADVVPIGERRLRASRLEADAKEAKEIANAELIDALGAAGATVMWCSTWRATYRPDKNGKRSLLVKPVGEAKIKARKPKANAAKPPALIEDGEVF